jgi:integrase
MLSALQRLVPRSTSWLRTTSGAPCARLCHLAGGELDQIQFLLGHVSIQTTERYLGCKQKLRIAVNDRLESNPMPLDPDHRQGGCINPPWATTR